ncbi:ABC transporter ATP-binding protein [Methylophilus medardicus]|uniref:ATP-binding cassette domain-containing protein n=1 Tax=Methylophilus medardicus TaxID=2588534 RepID=A0A5B8CPB4_9PROT|nr:ATP-binding cassette domain-containing protein [Methylophilus medardicus]QDC43088.1 ATP-binding cassette domain-containing protein [Methylophilus medardicus]QDC48095.1 ATP-binding cassette domain-containing protein [Methylophilus medardicus]QDC51800.1 ATP-binding cassette domain-containing protein [Methylophilus medardicus]
MQSPYIVEALSLSKAVVSNDTTLPILTDLNLAVPHGERLAIIGSSGSGKSTLLGLLAGLDTPSGGKVLIAGADIGAMDEDGRAGMRAKYMGFVFQSFQLLGSLTALENVMLPLQLAGRRDAEAVAVDALASVGLTARGTHYPKQLSGGEQQRVAIARAFAAKPAILFADEPTGNLDVATGEAIIQLLFDLNAQNGTTLVLVTHDMHLARRCQRVLNLQQGVLTEMRMPDSPSGAH